MAGKVLKDRREAEIGKGSISRRNVILGGAAGLAIAGTGGLFGGDLLLRMRANHLTSTAQLLRVELSDGTVVTLGPDSAIRTDFTASTRRVELLAGMGFFEVVADAGRPFQAVVENLTTTVLGTAFELSEDAGLLTVSVEHGSVGLKMPGSPLSDGERLGEGDWLALNGRSSSIERGRRNADQVASWRDGIIIAERETVASVVARIARWQPGRVLIADPSFGARTISGVFDVGDPVAALQAVIHPHGGKVRQISPWLTVLSPI
jgi:transmembrane sensor